MVLGRLNSFGNKRVKIAIKKLKVSDTWKDLDFGKKQSKRKGLEKPVDRTDVAVGSVNVSE